MSAKSVKRTIAGSGFLVLLIAWLFLSSSRTIGQQAATEQPRDPKSWGNNHVGKNVPDYVHGDECLFCHRNTIGAHWQKNAHGVAIRQLEDAGNLPELLKRPELATVRKDIDYFLGSRHRVRFLKKDGFGKFMLLNTQVELDANGQVKNWIEKETPTWDKEKFANQCAGCHATGNDPKTKTFSAFGLDCYVCHGDVNLEHANNTKLMILSKQRRNEPEIITSICAQCHLRESKSMSTGLPFPNNFIAGDNVFQDLSVDWAKADDEKLNRIDRHIYRNVRDVALLGKTSTTCISCHQVHFAARPSSITKHKALPMSALCSECHVDQSSMKALKPYTRASRVCEY